MVRQGSLVVEQGWGFLSSRELAKLGGESELRAVLKILAGTFSLTLPTNGIATARTGRDPYLLPGAIPVVGR